jgi:hypothetical protein
MNNLLQLCIVIAVASTSFTSSNAMENALPKPVRTAIKSFQQNLAIKEGSRYIGLPATLACITSPEVQDNKSLSNCIVGHAFAKWMLEDLGTKKELLAECVKAEDPKQCSQKIETLFNLLR